jgi:hypothetical protein
MYYRPKVVDSPEYRNGGIDDVPSQRYASQRGEGQTRGAYRSTKKGKDVMWLLMSWQFWVGICLGGAAVGAIFTGVAMYFLRDIEEDLG